MSIAREVNSILSTEVVDEVKTEIDAPDFQKKNKKYDALVKDFGKVTQSMDKILDLLSKTMKDATKLSDSVGRMPETDFPLLTDFISDGAGPDQSQNVIITMLDGIADRLKQAEKAIKDF